MTAADTFDGLVADRAAAGGRTVLVREDGGAVDADAFDRMAGRAAAWLRGHGVGRGDRIALWLDNRPEWLAILFGAARLGAVVAAVNTRYRTAELQHILGSAGARMLVFGTDVAGLDWRAVMDGLDLAALPDLASFAAVGGGAPASAIGRPVVPFAPDGLDPLAAGGAGPDDPVLLFTTSGTTSVPKLVVHSQGSLVRHARLCAASYGFDRDGAAYLAAMPFCGVFGLNPLLAAVVGGAPARLQAAFDVDRAVSVGRDAAITHFFGSDEMFRRMWAADRTAFRTARLCGFAAFTPGLETALLDMAEAGLPLAGVYGASEVNAIFAIQPSDMAPSERLKGGGRPAAGGRASVRVRDGETGRLCPDGTVGMLEVRAETNFGGYFRNPEATATAVDAEGYFRTGDVGYRRGDGTFVYLARGGDVLRLSGFLTDPQEIEQVIEQAEGVAKAQVVGVAWEGRTRPVAFVTAAEGAAAPEEGAIRAHAERMLAHYKVPLRVVVLPAFPTVESANGLKIQKARLRAMASDLLAEEGGA